MKQRPNIIVFFTDQQRADSTGAHGNPLGLTPNFDRIAGEGTFFSNACTCQPVCAPARSSLQTGLYATETGVWRNRKHLDPEQKTLAHHFNKAGYSTAYIGKWHLAGVYTGKDDWKQAPVPLEKQGGYKYWLGAELPEFTSDEYHTLLFNKEGNPVRLPGYRSDAYLDEGIRYIRNHEDNRAADGEDQPFFLFLSLFEPHHQNHRDYFPAPDGYEEQYRGRWTPPDLAGSPAAAAQLGGYWGMIKRIDEGFGRLLDALKSMSLMENTIILFASDHGCHFKTRNSEYKRSCHESSIRIPCAVIGPGFNKKGKRSEAISIVDLPATLLDAAGLEIPEEMQGYSILPALKNEAEFPCKSHFIQISEDKVSRAIRTDRWKYAVTAFDLDGNEFPASDRYREEFLYDLGADPFEQQNLIGFEAMKDVQIHLRELMKARIKEIENIEAEIEPAPPAPLSGQRRVLKNEVF